MTQFGSDVIREADGPLSPPLGVAGRAGAYDVGADKSNGASNDAHVGLGDVLQQWAAVRIPK